MKPMLVFQTDFTYKEGAVCAMYGVVKSVDRELEIIDGSHEIPQYDIYSASYRLYQSMKFWPEGTIFVSVVDPGVGTSRKACVAKTSDGYYVVTPDNGTLTYLKKFVGIDEIREIDETINRLHGKGTEDVAIFHGRDLFGYCAARLASGIITYEQVGPSYALDEIKCFDLPEAKVTAEGVEGIFEINDPNFGNLWTNIPTRMLKEAGFEYGDYIHLVIEDKGNIVFDQKVLFHKSFGMAPQGDPIIYNNELMNVALAICMGNFTETYHVGYGNDVKVSFRKE
ncbi:MAG: SAM-dependent chlorinase/fluorinase [Erysipelotrichaceae bacterium]|nr:SAM-dependent chlorinase/fluorinase [Erysipelotrichaceae bacterium]